MGNKFKTNITTDKDYGTNITLYMASRFIHMIQAAYQADKKLVLVNDCY